MNNQVIALDADGVLLDYKAKRAYLLEKHTQVLILWTYIFLGKSTACVLSWCPLIPSFRWTQNGSVVHFILNIPVKHTPCSKVGHRLVRTKVEPFPKKQFVEMNVSNAAPRNSAVRRNQSFKTSEPWQGLGLRSLAKDCYRETISSSLNADYPMSAKASEVHSSNFTSLGFRFNTLRYRISEGVALACVED